MGNIKVKPEFQDGSQWQGLANFIARKKRKFYLNNSNSTEVMKPRGQRKKIPYCQTPKKKNL